MNGKPIETIRSRAAEVLLKAGIGRATGLGLLLREHRLALNLSLADVAEISGVACGTICGMELDARPNPTLKTMRALTKLYNLAPSVWFDEIP
jgi:transcriptional regulator with XRE-family HTH domain